MKTKFTVLIIPFLLLFNWNVKATDYGTKQVNLYEPYAEWSVNNSSYSGNAFDVEAEVTFTHSNSGETVTTQMFYDGNDTWKWRFTGTKTGIWSFTTSSSDNDLNGHSGTVDVNSNPDTDVQGFLQSHTQDVKKWAVPTAGGEMKAIPPHYAMWHGREEIEQYASEIDSYINLFIGEHGFTGFHIPVMLPEVWTTNDNPDISFFETLETVMKKIHGANALVHLWFWGDAARGWTPPGGINSTADKRLQRYICARLGAIPNWSGGYGFDLWEWVDENQLNEWYNYMHAHLGYKHYLGGRADKHSYTQISEQMDYSSYELHVYSDPQPWYEQWVKVVAERPGKPAFSEDRFRTTSNTGKSKDVTYDEVRRGLYYATMAGGAASIWGNLMGGDEYRSYEYPNKEQLKTWNTFFVQKDRFKGDMERRNDLSSDAWVLHSPSLDSYVAYQENTSSVNLEINVSGSVTVLAVNTKEAYTEINLGNYGSGNHTFDLQSNSDWVIAVGSFGSDDPPVETYTLTVENGSGDGDYAEGSTVEITANDPARGKRFAEWTGDVANVADVNSSSTTITMPASNASIAATYEDVDEPETGIIASWNFYNNADAPSKAPDQTATGANVSHAALGEGLVANDYMSHGLTGRGQTSTTLSGAINEYEYFGFTITPDGGNTVSVTSVEIRPVSQNKERTFVLLSSKNGFTDANIIGSFTAHAHSGGNIERISVGGHNDITNPLEFRVYVYTPVNPNQWEAVGCGNSAAEEMDLIVNGSVNQAETTYALTVNHGTGSGNYTEGAEINISANEAPDGKQFSGWTGDVAIVSDVNSSSTVITMPASDATVTANYESIPEEKYTLTVNSGIGSGNYTEGTTVPIQADAAPSGMIFDQWSGDISAIIDINNASTSVFMPPSNITISANYKEIPNGDSVVITNISKSTYQTGILSMGNEYYVDRSYTLTGIPANMEGLQMIMPANNDKNQTAVPYWSFDVSEATIVFVAYDSRATSLPDWMSSYTATGNQINTTDVPLDVYAIDVQAGTVEMGANSAQGSAGANTNYLTIVDGQAGDTPVTYQLGVSATNGSITKNPDKSAYEAGETVEITAIPDPGYLFDSWSGDVSGSDNPASIVMDADKSVTANFIIEPEETDNLLSNGEFDNGKTSWTSQFQNGATGSLNIVTDAGMSGENAAKMTITDGGTSNWNVELFSLFNMESGKTYEISFQAKAESKRSALLVLQKNTDPWSHYWQQSVNIQTTPESFTFTWTADVTDANTRVNFKLGADNSDVWIDNVVVKETVDQETQDTSSDSAGTENKSANQNAQLEINPGNQQAPINIYPNPAQNKVYIKTENAQVFVVIYDISGSKVINSRDKEIDVSSLPAGIYFVMVNGKQFKLIKK